MNALPINTAVTQMPTATTTRAHIRVLVKEVTRATVIIVQVFMQQTNGIIIFVNFDYKFVKSIEIIIIRT